MKYFSVVIMLLIANLSLAQELTNIEYNATLLKKIRVAANAVPGNKPKELRYIKFAESPRTFSVTVEGGDKTPYIQARTAYQLVFEDSWIMIDAGMDKEVHQFFGHGKEQPYFQSAYDTVQQALKGASEILITHEHGDHIAGVLRSDYYDELAPKTLLTKQMVNTLLTHPQMPELAMKEEQLSDFQIIDFQDVLPVAPGVVLIKAPGHTPGEIMVYIRFDNGKEYIVTGDVSWSYVGINEQKHKPLSQVKRIGEDLNTIVFQLEWLNEIQSEEKIQLIVNHDDIFQPELVKQGIMEYGFVLE